MLLPKSANMIFTFAIISLFQFRLTFGQDQPAGRDNRLINKIQATDGFIALWKFDEKPGAVRNAIGKNKFPLEEGNGKIERMNEGPVSGFSIKLDGTNYLSLPNAGTGDLNIYGDNGEVTMVAWVKWTGEQTGFVGGMWNETTDGGRRQYGLFISLPYYNGNDQVCGHISKTGKPTPPFPYSIDYSASKQEVPAGQWSCVAFTYDGHYIRSYYNGLAEGRTTRAWSRRGLRW